MKNILFISHDSVPYGAPKSMLNIIDGLKDDVNFIVLLPYHGSIVDDLEKNKIKWYISRYYWDIYSLSSFKDFLLFPYRFIRHYVTRLQTIWLIVKLHQIRKFDAIHSNSGVIRVGFYAAKLLKIPHIWHVREFQTIDYSLNILFGKKHLIKLFKKSDITICVSQSVKRFFQLDESVVIYNGVLSTTDDSLLFEKDDCFIFAGSLLPSKGIYDVLSAFISFSKQNNTTVLKICGTGNEQNTKRIEAIIQEANLQHRIQLLGYRNDIVNLLKKARGCIVASHNEAFGRITAEAMLIGCPIIGKATEGTLELIQSATNGFLFTNETELLNALLFLSNVENKEKITEKIISSKLRAELLFTQEILCEKMLEIYTTLKKQNEFSAK